MLRLETNNDYAVSVKQIAYFSHEAGKVSRFPPKRTVQYWSRLPTEVAEAPPCRFSGLSYLKPWLFCSRANNSSASSGKPDQLTPEALPTLILWFLSFFLYYLNDGKTAKYHFP